MGFICRFGVTLLETVSLLPPNDPVSNVRETRALPFFFLLIIEKKGGFSTQLLTI